MKPIRLLGVLALGIALWAADPAVGTWKLNLAKSKYTPGTAPRSATTTHEETADGIRRTGESISADGKTTNMAYTAKYDGKEYPVTGSDLYDAISIKRVDDRTSTAVLKKSGKVMGSARRVISRDGKTMTLTVTGVDPNGRKMTNISVYDKQ